MTARRKKQRLSAEESRERLIEAGVTSLGEQGLAIGLDAVNLEQAVRDTSVPRSSAYAAWSVEGEFSPQEAFQRAVLMRAVETRRDSVDNLMAQVGDFLSNPPAGLTGRALLRELIRVGGNYNLASVVNSRPWKIVFSMRSIVNTTSQEQQDEELLEWMAANEIELRLQTIETLYKPMAEIFGFRPRPEFGERAWHLIEIAHSALVEGLAMRMSTYASDYFEGLVHPDQSAGEANWSIYALLFERSVNVFFEFLEDE